MIFRKLFRKKKPVEILDFTFEGQPVRATRGQTIAAALTYAGILSLRESARSGEFRGVMCGMGVCGECNVLIDGRTTRACMTEVEAGMAIKRKPRLRPVPTGKASETGLKETQ